MCSASMGAEGSVTLQLREAVQAPDAAGTSLSEHGGLTIGYPDPEMLADMLGSFQSASAAGLEQSSASAAVTAATFDLIQENSSSNCSSRQSGLDPTEQQQQQQQQQHTIASALLAKASSPTGCSNSSNSGSSSSSSNGSGGSSSSNGGLTLGTLKPELASKETLNGCLPSTVSVGASSTGSSSNSTSNSSSSGNSGVSSNSKSTVAAASVATVNSANSNNSTMIVSGAPGGHSSRSDSTSSCSSTSSSSSSSSGSSSSSSSSSGSNSSSNGSSGSSTLAVTVNGLPTVVKKPRPKTVSPTRHGPQQCQVCSKVFGNASALAKHKLTHSDERKYVCITCSKAFKRQDHLNGHMLTHRNKKPYECKAEGCGKSYCDARSLRRHTENHHSAVGMASGPSTPLTVAAASPTGGAALQSVIATMALTTTTTTTTAAMTTGPLSGLSLSPATASGDASSPHGATTCSIQFSSSASTTLGSASSGGTILSSSSASSSSNSNNSNHGHQSDSSGTGGSSKSLSPSSPAGGSGNEGLTRQQLDLITQIMQQTKQANAAAAAAGQKVHPRPRTWNMQLQLSQHKLTPTSSVIANSVSTSQSSSSQSLTSTSSITTQAAVSVDSAGSSTAAGGAGAAQSQNSSVGQALNKSDQKPVECNLCHRKFKNIPALNGHMRLHGGYFKKDSETKKCDKKEHTGPPLQTASVGVRALIEEKIINKRSKDLKNLLLKGSFVVPAAPLTARRLLEASEALLTPKPGTVAIVSTQNGTTQIINPKATIMAAAGGALSVTTNSGGLPTEVKDATLIELLKRGTKVAVKRTCSDPGQLAIATQTTQSSIATSATTRTVVLPANLNTASSTTGGALSIANSLTTTASSDSTPLSLTISQAPSGSADVFTLAYSTDATGAAAFFSDNDVYSVSDTTMLLQAVDSIQLLQDPSSSDQLDEIASLSDYTTINEQTFTPSRQLQAVLDSPLPESLAEFSALHSKDFILYSGSSSNAGNNSDPTGSQTSNSPLPSPLAYPTPPASHEPVTQASPFLDDSRHFSDASSFFDDKRNTTNFLDDGFFKVEPKDVKLNDEKILALKNELLDENHDLFRSNKNILDEHCHELFKSEDSFFVEESSASKPTDSSISTPGNVHSPSKINLDFLDEAQAFINENRNASSPLSNAFFSATMSSAEEVKEALEEVLPSDEDVAIAEADIDLYYLNGLSSLQSQMMPNSDDPLLSSSPKDFAHRQHQKFLFEQQQQQQQQQQLSQQQLSNNNNNNNSTFSPPSAKKLKTEADAPAFAAASDTNKIPLTVQTEQIPKDNPNDSVFLSPSSISSTSSSGSSSSPKLQHALLRKRPAALLPTVSIRKSPIYHSKLRKSTTAVPVTHYTPQPMLNPNRTASGLYSTIASTLASQSSSVSDSTVDDTSDIFSEPPLPIRPRINLGNDYQATIPDCTAPSYNQSNNQSDQHMWDPVVVQNETQIARYVELSRSSAVPLGCHSEETALKALLEAQGEIHIAILNLMQTPATGLHRRWSPSEMEQFIRGLELYGKDFFRIASELLPAKSTDDCVQLYYFWKKLCVDYKTTHLLQHGDNSMKFINMNVNPDDLLLDHAAYTTNTVKSSGLGHHSSANSSNSSSTSDVRPHVCEVPDCSASFSSKAALHGHIRIHCIGRSAAHLNGTTQNGNFLSTTAAGNPINPNHIPTKDDYPCKVCGNWRSQDHEAYRFLDKTFRKVYIIRDASFVEGDYDELTESVQEENMIEFYSKLKLTTTEQEESVDGGATGPLL
ncbi:serine-rich adhesin for platelets [Sabethes cyaneus]|uniref:serine-rich adhesin for platelets n=1 Tax=Sabethes cyaneus TaxID=53552 RepID=UPI00237E87F8|nr:serine-rich adhesin for platelets [Sabethes cyaneus]